VELETNSGTRQSRVSELPYQSLSLCFRDPARGISEDVDVTSPRLDPAENPGAVQEDANGPTAEDP